MSSPEMALPSLPPQLETCAKEFRHACEDARTLLTYSDEETVRKRPSPASWSPLECVAHLNLATQAMLPGIRQAVEAAPSASGAPKPYRMDLIGRLLAWSLEPPPLIKMKASKIAEPVNAPGPEPVLQEFQRLHEQLIELLCAAAGKAIDQQKMKSPFADVQYNTYSAFRILCAHDRRHLWQAHKALQR